jgi:hypothetical protein
MEPEDSLQGLEDLSAGHCTQPDESSLHIQNFYAEHSF